MISPNTAGAAPAKRKDTCTGLERNLPDLTAQLTPLKYTELTEEQKNHICNGCGGKSGTGWLRFVQPPNLRFKASCSHHDYGYYIGGDPAARLNCDIKFLAAMCHDAYAVPGFRRVFHVIAALAYFFAVRFKGDEFFFNTDTPRDTVEELMADMCEAELIATVRTGLLPAVDYMIDAPDEN